MVAVQGHWRLTAMMVRSSLGFVFLAPYFLITAVAIAFTCLAVEGVGFRVEGSDFSG